MASGAADEVAKMKARASSAPFLSYSPSEHDVLGMCAGEPAPARWTGRSWPARARPCWRGFVRDPSAVAAPRACDAVML